MCSFLLDVIIKTKNVTFAATALNTVCGKPVQKFIILSRCGRWRFYDKRFMGAEHPKSWAKNERIKQNNMFYSFFFHELNFGLWLFLKIKGEKRRSETWFRKKHTWRTFFCKLDSHTYSYVLSFLPFYVFSLCIQPMYL